MTCLKKMLTACGMLCSLYFLFAAPNVVAQVVTTNVEVNESSLTIVSSRRLSRTTMEYELTASVSNSSSNDFLNVSALLTGVPLNVSIVDGEFTFGDVKSNETVTSIDTITLRVIVRGDPSGSFVWQVLGQEVVSPPPPPPPPPNGIPSEPELTGTFVYFDDSISKEWIRISSWQQGAARAISSALDRESSRVSISEMVLSKVLDDSSVAFSDAMLNGKFFDRIKIIVRAGCGDFKFYTSIDLTIADGIISTFSRSGSSESIHEAISINMGSLDTVSKQVDRDCKVIDSTYSYQDFN
jgi:type VI protein secretion system component Hcp